ncbi:MAG: methionine adenosyltransferase [Syntrophorhabdaceae bacterium]|nr:methionine adenosyltransferase [Syntrophorhabdaceae bacterium]
MKKDFIFTSESATEGHPDKLCDQISDSIIDHFLQIDPFSRVIAECAVATSIVFIAVRFASHAIVDFSAIARDTINRIGYTQPTFNAKTCSVITNIKELPMQEYVQIDERNLSDEEISKVPVKNQVTVFGFACNQTPSLMPLPIWLAHKLSRKLTSVRLQKILPYLAPDGKTQVGVEYRERKPYRIHSITIIASQLYPDNPGIKRLYDDIYEAVLMPTFLDEDIKPDNKTHIFVNPDGPFITGGPSVHSGLTGKKIGIDTYGEYARQGAAALSGKGPSRIDRVGVYIARYAAKNIVAAGLAEECEIQLSYSIGLPGPVSIQVETFGTGKIPDYEIASMVEQKIDFRLAGIIKRFNLRFLPSIIKGGFYKKLSAYGHVGRMDIGLPWEITDIAPLLKQ